MPRVVIVGGGLAGCGAALAAKKVGAEVILLERTDMLAGVAVRAGETHGNGEFVCHNELRFLGGNELPEALESIKLHDNVPFPDGKWHSFIYNTGLLEPLVKKIVLDAGIQVHLESRVVDVKKEGRRVIAVKLGDDTLISGGAFVDCTGTRGGVAVCNKYGKGCVMCLVRCFAFGDRLGLADKAGAEVYDKLRMDGTPGRINAAMKMFKDTLAPHLKAVIEKEGLVKVPVPKEMVDYSKVKLMGASRSEEFVENIVLGDIGPVAKGFGMVYMELDKLRQIKGFENVQVEDPRAPRYNHVGHVNISVSDTSFKVEGIDNLFCAGEKAGLGSVCAAITTGYMAGNNAARITFGREPLVLPRSLALGDFLAWTAEARKTIEGRNKNYHVVRGEYWERMQKIGLYTSKVEGIKRRVEEVGLTGVLSKKLG